MERVKTCEICKTTSEEFIKTNKIGCINCYKTFEKEVSDFCVLFHGKDIHNGKNPLQPEKDFKLNCHSFDSDIVLNISLSLCRSLENFALNSNEKNFLSKYCKDDNFSITFDNNDIFINGICKEFDIKKCYVILSEIDRNIYQKLGFAFDNKFGYLTSKVKNIGTGLHIETKMLLPSITKGQKLTDLNEELKKLGFLISKVNQLQPNLYSVKNFVTLGVSEKQILETAIQVILAICKAEKEN